MPQPQPHLGQVIHCWCGAAPTSWEGREWGLLPPRVTRFGGHHLTHFDSAGRSAVYRLFPLTPHLLFLTLTTFGYTSSVSTLEYVPQITTIIKYSAGDGHCLPELVVSQKTWICSGESIFVELKTQNKNEEMMWQISWEKCLNICDEFILPLCDEILTWQKAGGWWSVTVISMALLIPGRTLWQVKGAVFHPLHVLHVICCTGWRRCERWAAHHSLGLSLAFPIRHLMYSVYSWPLQCQEVSCHRILIEFTFFACFVENMASQEMQPCCRALVICWCTTRN